MARLRAVVRVILEVEADSVWSSDTTFDQISKQAEDGVRNMLLGGNSLAMKDLPRKIKSAEMLEVRVIKES